MVAGIWVTGGVISVPFVRFAYDNPQFHLALEVAEGVIAPRLAYLIYDRFRRPAS